MKQAKDKKTFSFSDGIRNLMILMREIQVPKRYFLAAAILSFFSMCFQLLEVGILFPFIKAVIAQDFSVMQSKRLAMIGGWGATWGLDSYHGQFLFWVVVLFLIAVFHNGLSFAASLILNQQVKAVLTLVRKKIFERYLRFGKMFFDRTNMMRLNAVLINHTDAVGRHLKNFHHLLAQGLLVMGYAALLFWVSWKLTLVAAVIFAALNFVTARLIARIRDDAQEKNEMNKALDLTVFNILSGIPLVQASGREEKEMERFSEVNDKDVELESQLNYRQEMIQPIENGSTLVALLLLAGSIPWLMPIEGTAQFSALLIFFFLARRIIPAINAVSKFRLSIARASTPLTSVLGVLKDDEDKYIVPSGSCNFPGLQQAIEFRDLNFEYRSDRPVFKGISFTIEKGKVTALVGATGFGKTTLAHLLLRFYDCPPATIFIDGVDIRDFEIGSLRRSMALVSQDIQIFHDTLRNNLTYEQAENSGEGQLKEVLKQVRLDELVARLPEGLETVVGDRGVQLSGGERQRVALARAILKKAPIIILDEATSALDSKTEKEIHQSLRETIKGKTALIIAHRLSTVQDADSIVVLANGRVVEKGAPSVLLNLKGCFYQFWQDQNKVKNE